MHSASWISFDQMEYCLLKAALLVLLLIALTRFFVHEIDLRLNALHDRRR